MSQCPTPEKHQHNTEAGALRQRDSAVAAGKNAAGTLDVYECRCGHWHVGHAAKRFEITIRLFPARKS